MIQPSKIRLLVADDHELVRCGLKNLLAGMGAQVVGVPDARWGEAVTAFVELKPDAKYTADDIIKKCKEHLTAFKVPKKVLFIESGKWPTSATAKIRKIDLRQIAARALSKS